MLLTVLAGIEGLESTSKATRIGTLAALCMGVAEDGSTERMRQPGFVGMYRSERGKSICTHRSSEQKLLWLHSCQIFWEAD